MADGMEPTGRMKRLNFNVLYGLLWIITLTIQDTSSTATVTLTFVQYGEAEHSICRRPSNCDYVVKYCGELLTFGPTTHCITAPTDTFPSGSPLGPVTFDIVMHTEIVNFTETRPFVQYTHQTIVTDNDHPTSSGSSAFALLYVNSVGTYFSSQNTSTLAGIDAENPERKFTGTWKVTVECVPGYSGNQCNIVEKTTPIPSKTTTNTAKTTTNTATPTPIPATPKPIPVKSTTIAATTAPIPTTTTTTPTTTRKDECCPCDSEDRDRDSGGDSEGDSERDSERDSRKGDSSGKGDTGSGGDSGPKGDSSREGDSNREGDSSQKNDTGSGGESSRMGDSDDDSSPKGDNSRKADIGIIGHGGDGSRKGDSCRKSDRDSGGDTGREGDSSRKGDIGIIGDSSPKDDTGTEGGSARGGDSSSHESGEEVEIL